MRARKLFYYKHRRGGVLIEMVIWSLPTRTAARTHGLKYRLYCGRGSHCVVRYDNETAKGDHRHYGTREEPYRFESLEKLVADFRADCVQPCRLELGTMNRIEIEVLKPQAALDAFAATWRRVRTGRKVTSRLAFGSLRALFSAITEKRLELIRHVAKHERLNTRQLSQQLERDYKNVYNDVKDLVELGLLDKDEGGLLTAPYDEIVIHTTVRDAA